MSNSSEHVEQLEKSNEEIPEMKTLSECINRMVKDGYTEDFKADNLGLLSLKSEKIYKADEVSVVNFFRFEGETDPQDNSILYAIETNDGTKGTLVDAYGPYADVKVSEFMKQVEGMQKKTNKK